MLNQLVNTGWKQGMLFGLALGGLLAWLIYIGPPGELGIDRAVRFLAASPPFSLEFVLDWPQEIQLGILVAWWTMTGAALGHLLRGSPRDITIAILFAFTLLCAHRLTDDNVKLNFRNTVHGIQQKLGF